MLSLLVQGDDKVVESIKRKYKRLGYEISLLLDSSAISNKVVFKLKDLFIDCDKCFFDFFNDPYSVSLFDIVSTNFKSFSYKEIMKVELGFAEDKIDIVKRYLLEVLKELVYKHYLDEVDFYDLVNSHLGIDYYIQDKEEMNEMIYEFVKKNFYVKSGIVKDPVYESLNLNELKYIPEIVYSAVIYMKKCNQSFPKVEERSSYVYLICNNSNVFGFFVPSIIKFLSEHISIKILNFILEMKKKRI